MAFITIHFSVCQHLYGICDSSTRIFYVRRRFAYSVKHENDHNVNSITSRVKCLAEKEYTVQDECIKLYWYQHQFLILLKFDWLEVAKLRHYNKVWTCIYTTQNIGHIVSYQVCVFIHSNVLLYTDMLSQDILQIPVVLEMLCSDN